MAHDLRRPVTAERERRIALTIARAVLDTHADTREDTHDPEARHWARLIDSVLDVLRDQRLILTEPPDV